MLDSGDDSGQVARSSRRTDIYALAITAWEILAGTRPYASMTSNQHQMEKEVLKGVRPPMDKLPVGTPQHIQNMISDCWSGGNQYILAVPHIAFAPHPTGFLSIRYNTCSLPNLTKVTKTYSLTCTVFTCLQSVMSDGPHQNVLSHSIMNTNACSRTNLTFSFRIDGPVKPFLPTCTIFWWS